MVVWNEKGHKQYDPVVLFALLDNVGQKILLSMINE